MEKNYRNHNYILYAERHNIKSSNRGAIVVQLSPKSLWIRGFTSNTGYIRSTLGKTIFILSGHCIKKWNGAYVSVFAGSCKNPGKIGQVVYTSSVTARFRNPTSIIRTQRFTYLISDTGNNQIVELYVIEQRSTLRKIYSISNPTRFGFVVPSFKKHLYFIGPEYVARLQLPTTGRDRVIYSRNKLSKVTETWNLSLEEGHLTSLEYITDNMFLVANLETVWLVNITGRAASKLCDVLSTVDCINIKPRAMEVVRKGNAFTVYYAAQSKYNCHVRRVLIN